MGYRSDVAYTIRFHPNSGNLFHTFLAEAKVNPDTAPCFAELVTEKFTYGHPTIIPNVEGLRIVDEGDKKQINFHTWGVKWYPSYEGVQCHEALLKMAKEYIDDDENYVDAVTHSLSGTPIPYKVCKLGYIYTVIGENLEDIHEDAQGEYDSDWLCVSRTVHFDWNELSENNLVMPNK